MRLAGTTLGALADDERAFAFPDVPIGTHTLLATFEQPAPGGTVSILVPGIEIRTRATGAGAAGRNGRDLGTLLLTALGTVSGEVTTGAGAPVAGAQVVANGQAWATTGANGRCAIKLPAGDFDFVAVYPDATVTRATEKVALRVRGDATLNFSANATDADTGTLAGAALLASRCGAGARTPTASTATARRGTRRQRSSGLSARAVLHPG